MNKKWADFVKERSNSFGYGVFLDETIQIIGMIKAGVCAEKIRKSLLNIGSYKTVIDYLSRFIHPEILCEIDCKDEERE